MNEAHRIVMPEPAGWVVELTNGVTWHPNKGQVPNAFHRLMQRLFFGFKWKRL